MTSTSSQSFLKIHSRFSQAFRNHTQHATRGRKERLNSEIVKEVEGKTRTTVLRKPRVLSSSVETMTIATERLRKSTQNIPFDLPTCRWVMALRGRLGTGRGRQVELPWLHREQTEKKWRQVQTTLSKHWFRKGRRETKPWPQWDAGSRQGLKLTWEAWPTK